MTEGNLRQIRKQSAKGQNCFCTKLKNFDPNILEEQVLIRQIDEFPLQVVIN
jgi:hypothetical protein